jgi:hypothetical protein
LRAVRAASISFWVAGVGPEPFWFEDLPEVSVIRAPLTAGVEEGLEERGVLVTSLAA